VLLVWVVGPTPNTQAHRCCVQEGAIHAHYLLPTPKRTGVVYRRNTCTLLPVYKPSARRLDHLVSEQSTRLGGLSASRLEHLGPQLAARLGGLSASRLELLGPQKTARLDEPIATVLLASFPQHCQHPSFPREERETRELACPFHFHAWLVCERRERTDRCLFGEPLPRWGV